MNREDAVLQRRLIRQARPPAEGTSVLESGAGRISSGPISSETVVDEDGNVRRLWQPGDPWSSDFYFGESD